jgi:hypothetical protein
MTLQVLTAKIVGWANDRCLLEERYLHGQFLKLAEELGETAAADVRGELNEVMDGVGDVYVVSAIMAAQIGQSITLLKEQNEDLLDGPVAHLGRIASCLARGRKDLLPSRLGQYINSVEREAIEMGIELLPCVEMVWEIIKDRKGRMVDGVFIKENDNG